MSASLQSVGASAATIAYQLAYQVSPIILVNGIATGAPDGKMPIISITGQLNEFLQNGLPNSFFAQYVPIPGATFIAQSAGQYPFANQQVAANAVIQQPRNLSLLMMCPVQNDAGYRTKLSMLSAYQQSLSTHNQLGGSYIIATPGLIFQNGVMLGMTAVDSGESKQQQINFQLDFYFPLITLQQAQQVQNNLMQTATNGGQVTGTPSWSGLNGAGAVGSTGLQASIAPAATGGGMAA